MPANSSESRPALAWIDRPGRCQSLCGRRVASFFCILLVALLSACAPLPLVPYGQATVPTVNLPLAHTGIGDHRQAFAALFGQIQKAHGFPAQGIKEWLHGVADAGDADHTNENDRLQRFRAMAADTSVLVVPGLLSDCVDTQSVPFGDGVVRERESSHTEAYRQYADLGLNSVRMVPLAGRASSNTNGAALAQAILTEASRPGVLRIVLVGYSKGVADAMVALNLLASQGQLPQSLVALVSVAGTVMGSPVADYFEPLYNMVSARVAPLDCAPSQGGDIESVSRHERVAWLAAHTLPAAMRYYSIVAHAPVNELASPLRLLANLLAEQDARNDGQMLMGDSILPRSALLAEARADHWDVALPRNRHPSAWVRAFTSGRDYPREALFRALIVWVLSDLP